MGCYYIITLHELICFSHKKQMVILLLSLANKILHEVRMKHSFPAT